MTNILTHISTSLGLKNSEARVLLICIQNQHGLSIKEVTSLTRLKRSTAVVILERLSERGLITHRYEGARRVFNALDPDQLLFHLQQKMEDFRSLLPALLRPQTDDLPSQVRFFQGKKGTNMIFNDMLMACRLLPVAKREILTITSGSALMRALPDHLPGFIRRRVKERIALRWIGPDHRSLDELKKKASTQFRQMRFFNEANYPFAMEIDIYANRLALIALGGREHVGVVIQQSEMADSFRSLFALIWNALDSSAVRIKAG
jgi:HTH-type transcriptional regulator, sugar sensing transcriptional regulator